MVKIRIRRCECPHPEADINIAKLVAYGIAVPEDRCKWCDGRIAKADK